MNTMLSATTNKHQPHILCLLLFLIGIWIALSSAIGFVAGGNFRVVDLKNLRNGNTIFHTIEQGEPRRQALRYIASELNRYYFAVFQWLNIGLALSCLWLIFYWQSAAKWQKILLSVCSLIAVFSLFFIPYITTMGRSIDFLPRASNPPEVQAFLRQHFVYLGLEGLKYLFIWAIAFSLLNRARKI